MLRTLLAVVASCLMITGALSQDGARAYFLLPEDTNIASLTGTLLHSENAAGKFDVGVVTPSYRRSIDLGGNAGAILIGMPIGSLSAALNTMIGVVNMNTPPAQGDLFVGGELGLVGSPSLAPMDYVQHKPGLRASVAAKLFMPTGDYDSSRLLNLGQNRWSLQAALPISFVLADSMVDPALTTFEIVPSVQIFGDNNDAFGAATVSSQAPLWKVEGHITHNFAPTLWAALDGYYKFGGQTSADGVPNPDAQSALSLGATLGLVLSPSLALRLSYAEQVYSNVPNSSARGVELTTAFRF
jgi:hypothetical protein